MELLFAVLPSTSGIVSHTQLVVTTGPHERQG